MLIDQKKLQNFVKMRNAIENMSIFTIAMYCFKYFLKDTEENQEQQ